MYPMRTLTTRLLASCSLKPRSIHAARIGTLSVMTLGLLLAAGCERVMNGPQKAEEEQVRPDQIHNFDALYKANCAGCHGADGKNGPAIPMNNPVYMSLVSDEQIRNVTANGQTGTLMPAFARSAGGLLTDEQINVLVAGMRQRWANPSAVAGLTPPPYATHLTGDAAHGQQVYAAGCASCHGSGNANGVAEAQGRAANLGQSTAQGQGTTQGPAAAAKGGSVTDPTFLALLSDQSLRTIIIAGRPDIGQPDWRGDIAGHALTDQEVTDVVAWLASHRKALPGQTHPDPAPGASELERRVQ